MSKKSKIVQLSRNRYCVILSTFPTRKGAEKVAGGLIREKLAACCNVIPGLTSFFSWKGKNEKCRESLLLIKTEGRCVKEASRFLKTHHPYDLPECLVLPIIAGEASYLAWIGKSCR